MPGEGEVAVLVDFGGLCNILEPARPHDVSVGKRSALDQLQPFQAGMAVLADDDVVMHGNAERGRDGDDRFRHLNVRVRRCRIA